MSTLTWLHLSDWHQHGKLLSRGDTVRQLIDEIKRRREVVSPDLSEIDFIVFTGDLAFSGKPDEYEAAASQLLDPILDATGVSKESLFIVPGNHDVEREYILEKGLLQELVDREAVHTTLSDHRRLAQLLETQRSFRAFIQRYLGEDQWKAPCWGWGRVFQVKGQTVGIAGINSAWLAGYHLNAEGKVDDERHLIIGETQARQALEGVADATIRIAMLHHPFDWLVSFENRAIKRMLMQHCHIILTGHTHMQDVCEIRDPNGAAVFIPAGSAYDQFQDLEYTNSYNFVQIDLSSGKGRVFGRRWSERRQKFVGDVDAFPDGPYRFTLPKKLDKGHVGDMSQQTTAANASFVADIEALKDETKLASRSLSNFASLTVGDREIRIERAVFRAILEATTAGSLVTVGEPGSGKSGTLHNLVENLVDNGNDVLLIAADRLNADSPGSLRNDLRLQHDLIDVLMNWSGGSTGYLVIDALDSARSVLSLRTYMEVIRNLIKGESRWRVVVSIRKFDLRYNRELQDLFSGIPPFVEFSDPEFSRVRHVNVPLLSDEELAGVRQESPEIDQLLSTTDAMGRLLRNPFNLKLVGLIVGHGVQIGELLPVTTRVELLSYYWQYRVLKDDHLGDAREELLRRTVGHMLLRRSLKTARSDIVDPAAPQHLQDLLSVGVLVEWQATVQATPDRRILAFSHHVLFDYAVSRLVLGDSQQLLDWLIEEPELLLAIRPSISMYFETNWVADSRRQSFWELALMVTGSGRVRQVCKVVAPSVAAALARSPEDLGPILCILSEPESVRRVSAERLIQQTVWAWGALLYGLNDTKWGGPWSTVAERLSLALRESTAPTLTFLLNLFKKPEELAQDDLRAVGLSARRLLEYALAQYSTSDWWISQGIDLVCRTYASDTAASRVLLNLILDEQHWPIYGHFVLRVLASHVPRLATLDSEMATNLYVHAFEYEETNRDTTHFGGQIVPLASNRKQDYEAGRYALADCFRSFVQVDHSAALGCLSRVLQMYSRGRHRVYASPASTSFSLNDRTVELLPDGSQSWDDGGLYLNDEPVMMLNALTEYAKDVAARSSEDGKWRDFLYDVGSKSRSAAIWRRIFSVATDHKEESKELLSVAITQTFLTSWDIARQVATWLQVVFPLLSLEQRMHVEEAILAIPDDVAGQRGRAGASQVRRLHLCSLPTDALVSEDAKTAQASLLADTPKQECEEGPFPVADVVTDQDLSEEVTNFALAEVRKLVKKSEKPNAEGIRRILPVVLEVWARFHVDEDREMDSELREILGVLARACSVISSSTDFTEVPEAIDLVRSISLHASRYPETRWASVGGLAGCCVQNGIANATVVSEIRALSSDQDKSVRMAVASNLFRLREHYAETMWELISERVRDELDPEVLIGLVSSLSRYVSSDLARGIKAVKQILARVTSGEGSGLLREGYAALLVRSYLYVGDTESDGPLLVLVDHPHLYPREVGWIAHNLRFSLTHGSVQQAASSDDLVRHRGWTLLLRMLKATVGEFNRLQGTLNPGEKPSEEVGLSLSNLANILDSIGQQVYFASGTFYEGKQRWDGQPLSFGAKQRFLAESADVVSELAHLGRAPITHNLLETLESFIGIDPSAVLRLIGCVIIAGGRGGYQYETLAKNIFIQIIDRYLAEFRHILQEDLECQRIVLNMLDMFIEAGWVEAHNLIYRLDEIYR